jgi:hypothetical protein
MVLCIFVPNCCWSIPQCRHLRSEHSISDARDGLDLKGFVAAKLGELSNSGNRAVDRVLAHNPATPAAPDQLITGHHCTVRTREHHEHLHDAGFENLVPPACNHLAQGRSHAHVAKLEILLVCEALRSDRLQESWPLVHEGIIGISRQSIGDPSGANPCRWDAGKLQSRHVTRAGTASWSKENGVDIPDFGPFGRQSRPDHLKPGRALQERQRGAFCPNAGRPRGSHEGADWRRRNAKEHW